MTIFAAQISYGVVLEWLKRHAWKACIPPKGYPEFESRSLRFVSL